MVPLRNHSRRDFLKTVGATAAIGGGIGIGTAKTRGLRRFKFVYPKRAFDRSSENPREACSISDQFTTLLDGANWPGGEVPYDVTGTTEANGVDLNDIVGTAFGNWPLIEGVEESGSNPIHFTEIDGSESTLGIAFVFIDEREREITQFEIQLDVAENWQLFSGNTDACEKVGNGIDALAVLVHEIGHVIGLGHLGQGEPHDGLTMYPFYFEGTAFQRTPDGGDVAGVEFLYG